METPLKVMLVLPCLDAGGAETMVADLAISLQQSGLVEVQVTSLFPSRPGLPRRLHDAGVVFQDLGKRRGLDPGVVRRLDDAVARFQPHVLHTHQYVLPYVLPVLLRHSSLPCVHTIHTLPHNETSFAGRLLQRLAFRGRVIPVAINSVVAGLTRAEYGLPEVPVVPNGIDLLPFYGQRNCARWRLENHIPLSAVVIACLAHLRPEKDHSLLLNAFSLVARDCPDALLLLIGDGPLRESIHDTVASLNLQDRVHLLGFREDIPDILAASDIGVLSSIYEGMPISVLQIMAAGLPVVATSVGGLPSLVQPGVTGSLVPHGRPVPLAAALRRLVLDAGERSRLGSNARVRALAEFGAGQMAAAYCRLYERAASPALLRSAS